MTRSWEKPKLSPGARPLQNDANVSEASEQSSQPFGMRELLEKLDADPLRALCRRLGIGLDLHLPVRLLLIGIALALQQPEFSAKPKRRRGRPKGTTKPVEQLGHDHQRKLVDDFERTTRSSLDAATHRELGDTISSIVGLLPVDCEPNGWGLANLIDAAGGIAIVSTKLRKSPDQLEAMIKADQQHQTDRAHREREWERTLEKGAVKSKGKEAEKKALKRLRYRREVNRIARALVGPSETE